MSRSLAVGAFLVVVTSAAVSLAVGHVRHHRDRLPYVAVDYNVHDARAAFAREGIRLTLRSRVPGSTDLASPRNVLEVTIFGAPEVVRRAGFRDLAHGPDCTVAGHLALHWRGNVRAILNCDLVADDRAWIARMNRALAALP